MREPRTSSTTRNQKALHDLEVANGHLIAVCTHCLHRAVVKPETQGLAMRQLQSARPRQRA